MAATDRTQEQRSATALPLSDADMYWGPDYSPTATTVLLDRESMRSRSPQPSDGEVEQLRDLVRELQRELLKETTARVSESPFF